MHNAMSRDVSRHFDNKLTVLVHDMLDTLQVGEVDPADAATAVIGPLALQLCKIVHASGGTEDDAVRMLQISFRTFMRAQRKTAIG